MQGKECPCHVSVHVIGCEAVAHAEMQRESFIKAREVLLIWLHWEQLNHPNAANQAELLAPRRWLIRRRKSWGNKSCPEGAS